VNRRKGDCKKIGAAKHGRKRRWFEGESLGGQGDLAVVWGKAVTRNIYKNASRRGGITPRGGKGKRRNTQQTERLKEKGGGKLLVEEWYPENYKGHLGSGERRSDKRGVCKTT